MRRIIKKNRLKLAAESQRLVNLALAVAQSASRIEDNAWQARLDTYVRKNLRLQHQDLLDAAAEHVFHSHPHGYEVLVETLETISTSCTLTHQGQDWQCLLVAAPVLAWTRYDIASGALPATILNHLHQQMQAHLLAPATRLQLLPNLYSIDQLPRNHCETFSLLEKQAQALVAQTQTASEAQKEKTVPFLADIRFLLAVIATPAGENLFRWQQLDAPYDSEAAKALCLEAWKAGTEEQFKHVLPGCGIDLLLPEAYFSACRDADVAIRPASILAAVYYLTQTLEKDSSHFRVVIGACANADNAGQIDELRLSFLLNETPEVIYGVIWPLYQAEDQQTAIGLDEQEDLQGDIPEILRQAGITDIVLLDEVFSMEFCDDCGTPLFPDHAGDLVHPEMPDDIPAPGTAHFH
ncbi:DUF2863 family protein [Undibacterium curvum]|uniref:DUF2863 family protein n=1 Tax=Undibacterium curvum TaxID=2762294 RepID=A0ABR7A0W5_9BURK|nr:DUF2863 family protein [Undibacterium curvum]MBC3930555.1 DUF2863 family protein [Undibacterium curvum]